MCTAIAFRGNRCCFGRTLDLEYTYEEAVVITPRAFPFSYRRLPDSHTHFAIMGIATVMDDFPLYYDAVNEHGLYMAGLNFVHSAVYQKPRADRNNLAQFELLPWILGSCRRVEEACRELEKINLTDDPFRQDLPAARLHWLLADRDQTVTLEPMEEGLRVYPNPVGVLTNEPPSPFRRRCFLTTEGSLPRRENLPFPPISPSPPKAVGLAQLASQGIFPPPPASCAPPSSNAIR